MNTREQLNQYLRGLETRLRWMTVSKGAAIAAGVALGATLALVLITNALAFSTTSMTLARVILFLSLALALGLALVLPLLRLNGRRAAGRAESEFPEFEERLLTFVERSQDEKPDPMLDLLAADTASVAERTQAERVAPPRSIFAFATSAGAAGAVLLWLILAGPGFLGYGASLLWAGLPKSGAPGFYDIAVQPGNALVRRKADQMVTAQLSGFQAPQVRIYARYRSTSKWEEATMLPRANGTAYEFLFAGLAEPVEYYVEAAGVRSKTYKLDVADLPGIKKIRVTYHYPSWLGLKDVVEDPGGDLRAVAGTVAELSIETDRPLTGGTIELDNGSHIALTAGPNGTVTAKIPIDKDGTFHYAAQEQGQSVRLSEDYFIEARQDNAPNVHITHPRSDAKVSPIEEVTVQVDADDDFALEGMELHYSVNGGAEKTVSLLGTRGVKAATGKTMIALEDYKLEPGDVVSIYATARDARTTSRTDIVFIETQPYERNYSQSQQMGGGGMGGGQQDDDKISQRQKEIIAATWNEIRGGAKDKVNSAENAKFLADVQNKLKEQATSLAQRARSRELAGANQEFQGFVKDMEEAANQMGPASDKLKGQSWKDALEPEQKALQHLLRAEATFRDIQVAFGSQGGGGGGGSAGRDLANLFDLELDTEKNQYETGQSQGSSAEQRQKDVDEALQKLEQLARRQQELAQQQSNSKQTVEQRWQQEMLRREAEELKKQIEQLSRNGQSSQSQSGQQGQQGQQGQSGQSGQPGQSGQQQGRQQASGQGGRSNGTNERQLQQAMQRLEQAADDMRAAQQAASQQNGQNGQSEANARRAAERLQEARDMLNGMQHQQASSQLGDMSQRADRLAQQQRDFSNRLRQAFGDQTGDSRYPRPGSQSGAQRQQAEQMAGEKEKMAADLSQLEKDMQKAARELAGTQPAASSRVRDGLSEIQQNEAQRRMQASADWIRRGQGGLMVTREAPVTEALDKMAEDLRQAQSALNSNPQGNGQSDAERSLARLERLRSQMEQMAARAQQQSGQRNGQQGGQQSGQGNGQQSGQGGQQGGQGGQQANGQQGSGQQGGNATGVGGPRGGGNRQSGGPFTGYSFGRYLPDGVYELPNTTPPDPNRVIHDAQLDLNELKQIYKDNPDVNRDISDVEHEIMQLKVGDISSAELENRINREVLPNLESLEVRLRREVEERNEGQVRSAATDRVPAGYVDAVAEYFRKLSKGK